VLQTAFRRTPSPHCGRPTIRHPAAGLSLAVCPNSHSQVGAGGTSPSCPQGPDSPAGPSLVSYNLPDCSRQALLALRSWRIRGALSRGARSSREGLGNTLVGLGLEMGLAVGVVVRTLRLAGLLTYCHRKAACGCSKLRPDVVSTYRRFLYPKSNADLQSCLPFTLFSAPAAVE
jgi:hypothetical protein